jgi:pimeloyl-ACP methyl ester carboxylesterase
MAAAWMASSSVLYAQAEPDMTAHMVKMIYVDKEVRLEVLDYGGTGRPMIFLAALGGDAHDWDKFAPKFVAEHHVYAITRRGFGASDKPEVTDENYDSDRLGDDVLQVMAALNIERPVLVGHSLGGEELSSIGSRYPEKVTGLIYLDAGYPYAFYNTKEPEPMLNRAELRRLLRQAEQSQSIGSELTRQLLASMVQNEEILRASLVVREKMKATQSTKPQTVESLPPMPPPPPEMDAIKQNGRKYTTIRVPILAIYAIPKDLSSVFKDPVVRAEEEAKGAAWATRQADAFEAGLPSARVIRIAHATHSVHESNEADVLREMNAFIAALPAAK